MLEFLFMCIGFAIILIIAACLTAYYCSMKVYLQKDSFRIRGVKGMKKYF